MHRFFINSSQITLNHVIFPPDLLHQIMHVLRMDEGDFVEVLINDGFAQLTELHLDDDRQELYGQIKEKYRVVTEPNVDLWLYFALSNREKVEWILQKGTEIGISNFCPFISSRSIVQKINLPEKKRTRWEKIIREAAEQSNRGKIPVLNSPVEISKGFYESVERTEQCILAWEGSETHRGKLINNIRPQNEGEIALFIGPEGGFSKDEVHKAESIGIKLVSLGPRILRMETAALIFPALVLFMLDEI